MPVERDERLAPAAGRAMQSVGEVDAAPVQVDRVVAIEAREAVDQQNAKDKAQRR